MGWSVDELLLRMNSRELSERMVLANLPWWEKRIADKNKDRSQQIMHALFGKAMARGAVKWGTKPL